MRIILASGSPRRKEILSRFGLDFEIIIPNCDENISASSPSELVEKLSLIKAIAVKDAICDNDSFIIAADTVVAYGNNVLGKPHSKEDAYNMLSTLSGNLHSVYTGITFIRNDKVITTHDKTDVFFYRLSEKEILEYIDTDEPYDKAGAYAIQGIAGRFVEKIEGSFTNVMGFPEELIRKILIEEQIIEK